MTKREMYEVIGKVFETGNIDLAYENKDDIMAMCVKEIAALDHKNESAKKRAAEKRAKGDELRARVEAVITDEPKTINQILEDLGDSSLTPAKVTARTRQLFDEGRISRGFVKVNGSKLTTYVKA